MKVFCPLIHKKASGEEAIITDTCEGLGYENEKCHECYQAMFTLFFLCQLSVIAATSEYNGDCEKCHKEVGDSILKNFGLRQDTASFKVNWRVGEDKKIYITTPFHPGRQPWNYGGQEGPTPGATGESSIEIIIDSSPSDLGFEQDK